MLRRFAMATLAGVFGAACGVGSGEPGFISANSAVVHCTVSGRQLQLPPLFLEIPSPRPPTGLYARGIEPIALDAVGFARDTVVCATLEAPTDARMDAAARGVEALHESRVALAQSIESLGACGCELLRAEGGRGLLDDCEDVATQSNCGFTNDEVAAVTEAIAGVRAALREAPVPWVHWRLFGTSDRFGRFAARHEDLQRFHDGGSEVFLKGTPIPDRGNVATLQALLEQPGVVAVVRQDSGRALLVVRELGRDTLVLDHFAYPDLASEFQSLLPWIDDAQVETRIAALAPPESPLRPLLDPREGSLVEFDHGLLDRVDRAMMSTSRLGDRPYREKHEKWGGAPVMFDRVAIQVPFGSAGKRARVRARLGPDGMEWLAPATKGKLSEHLRALSAAEVEPMFEPSGDDPGFVLRGRPIDGVWFRGATAFVWLLGVLEEDSSGRVQGSIDAFTVDIPSGPLPGEIDTREGLRDLRERLSLRPHRIEGSVVADTIDLEFGPQ